MQLSIQQVLLPILLYVSMAQCLSSSPISTPDKNIAFVRHGCTYMNEYLSRAVAFGAPGFSDVFESHELDRYLDSPLSPLGQRQAKALAQSKPSFLSSCELIVTSPLRRALQTLDLGLRPVNDKIPVVALPEAAERLYLISDVGRPTPELARKFDYIDFETGFQDNVDKHKWWYVSSNDYTEWRPTGKGQKYACPGEPQSSFHARMDRLLQWIQNRPESEIAIVCHWGVIDWMLDMDFDNCQWMSVPLSQVQSRLLQSPQRQELWQQ